MHSSKLLCAISEFILSNSFTRYLSCFLVESCASSVSLYTRFNLPLISCVLLSTLVRNLFSIYNLTYITQFINFIIIAVYNVVHHITFSLPQPPPRPYLSTAPADSPSSIHFCPLNTVDFSLFPHSTLMHCRQILCSLNKFIFLIFLSYF